jgi:uncharacterized protein DUF4386
VNAFEHALPITLGAVPGPLNDGNQETLSAADARLILVRARSKTRDGPQPGKGAQGVSLDQKRARVFGVLYLVTFVTSIPALLLYQPVLDDPVGYIAGAGHNNRIVFGTFLELLLIIANIGTAVVIFPIVKRQSEELALGYVTARLLESTFILVGVLAVLGIVTLQKEVAGAAEGSIAYTLAAIKDWTFLLGPGWVVGWGNGLILGYLMYRSRLVPRQMAWLGLVGGPLLVVAGTLVLFGVAEKGGTLQGLATIPEALWELSLGIYCAVKGFRPSSPILRADTGEDPVKAMPASAPA